MTGLVRREIVLYISAICPSQPIVDSEGALVFTTDGAETAELGLPCTDAVLVSN
jgi:hypothetical protein